MSPTHPTASLDGTGADRRRSWGLEAGAKTLDEVLTLDHDQACQTGAQISDLSRYPRSDDSEYITWARWDALPTSGGGSTMYELSSVLISVLVFMIFSLGDS